MSRKRKRFDEKVFSTSFGLMKKDLLILDDLTERENKSASSIVRELLRGKNSGK